jgi:hypothetical protein
MACANFFALGFPRRVTHLARMAPQRVENMAAAPGGAEAWFTPGRFSLILAVLIITCFPGVIFGFETFFVRDFGGFGYPLAFYQRESFWHGETPLWNPLNHCGLPFLAQWNTMTFYPPALFYLLLPLSWSLGVFCLGHLFWAGLGMYFLAHRWTGNRLAASLAGVIFAFNGLTWCALMWPNNISALGWMPWVVLAMELAWQAGGRHVILAGLAGALQMLAGAPEVIVLTWVAVGALALAHLVWGDLPRSRVTLASVTVAALVAGLTAVQLLPFADLLAHSSRDAGFVASFGEGQWAMPRTGWANYLVPLFHCFKGAYGVYFQNGQYWTTSYYTGVGAVLLGLLALWRGGGDRRVWLQAGLTGAALLLALGDAGGLYGWLRQMLPVLGFMRFPIKLVVLATFAIPLLAAHGLSRFQALPQTAWPAARKRMLCLALLLSGIMALIVWRAWVHPGPGEDRVVTLQNALVRGIFLALIAAALAALRWTGEFKLQLLLRGGLLMLLWFDVFTHEPSPNPAVERRAYQPGLIREFFHWEAQLQPGESRALPSEKSISTMMARSVGTPLEDMTGRRLALFANLNLLDQVPKFDGFYSLELREMHTLAAQVYSTTNDLPGLKDFLGVSHVSDPRNPVNWLSRDTFLPIITAGQKPVFEADETVLQELLAAGFDPRQSVYLPPEARPLVTATNAAEVKFLSRKFAAHHLEAALEAAAPALVVVAQAYYHPWHAYVDGKPAALFRANYAFQALEVPAGRHEIRLVYEDLAFNCGAVISLATLVICAAGWRRTRRPPGRA